MNFLVDLSVESDALMFKRLINTLKTKGHNVLVTTRYIPEANNLQKFINVKSTIVGNYSSTLEGKLLSSAERIVELTKLIMLKFNGHIDGVVSNTGVEASRVGFGFNCKVHTFHDHPNKEAEAQMKLTIPLSTYVYAPITISKSEYLKYGLKEWQIVSYNGFLSMAWMPYEKLNDNILEDLHLDKNKKIIVFRESETKSSYLYGKSDITLPAIKNLSNMMPDVQFVTRPRYSWTELTYYFKDCSNVTVFKDPIDMRSLFAKSTYHIGGGATMCLESAYLGIPTITCRPINSPITDYLEKQCLAVKAVTEHEIVKIVTNNIDSNNKYKRKSKNIFSKLEFPLDKLINNMEMI